MVAEWIVSLAQSGAGALVGAAATDAWQTARDGVVGLFRRSGSRRAELAADQLDADASTVERTAIGERDHVRQQLLPAWQTRLSDLLGEVSDDAGADGEVAAELRALTVRVLAQLPTPQQTWVMHVVAREGGRAFGVQGGDVHYHDYHGGAAPHPPRRDGDVDVSYTG